MIPGPLSALQKANVQKLWSEFTKSDNVIEWKEKLRQAYIAKFCFPKSDTLGACFTESDCTLLNQHRKVTAYNSSSSSSSALKEREQRRHRGRSDDDEDDEGGAAFEWSTSTFFCQMPWQELVQAVSSISRPKPL